MIESAWANYPDYRIALVPCPRQAEAWAGDVLIARSNRCLVVKETDHVDRLYFPESDVHWNRLTETDHHTICPFKGEADYWSLTAIDPPLENVAWTYRTPFPEVAGIEGHVAFYQERVRIVVVEQWPDGSTVHTSFPLWGDARDLLRLIDVEPNGVGKFVGAAYGDTARNVVEGGQLLGQAIAAAAKTTPGQRVVSASMIFAKAATFDAPIDVTVEVLRSGRTFSTLEARIEQGGGLRSAALLLMDAGADDVIRASAAMPDVAGPNDSVPYDFGLTGREIRVVDGAYDLDPQRVGPPEIYAWIRFRDAPTESYLHTALLSQAMTHWTIASALLPHEGFGEANAHVTLSTGIMQISATFHQEVDATDWHLYANEAIHAGAGLAGGTGRVFRQDGQLVASYTVLAMVRGFAHDSADLGGYKAAM